MKKKIKDYPFVYIKWLDSMSPKDGGWVTLEDEDIEEDYTAHCYSVGFLIDENKREYKVACSGHLNGCGALNTLGFHAIPKCSVVKIKKLRGK